MLTVTSDDTPSSQWSLIITSLIPSDILEVIWGAKTQRVHHVT